MPSINNMMRGRTLTLQLAPRRAVSKRELGRIGLNNGVLALNALSALHIDRFLVWWKVNGTNAYPHSTLADCRLWKASMEDMLQCRNTGKGKADMHPAQKPRPSGLWR